MSLATGVPDLAFRGRLDALVADARAALLDRAAPRNPAVEEGVRVILARVRDEGDRAVDELTLRFDGVQPARFEIAAERCAAALAALPAPLRRAMERSLANLERAHSAFAPAPRRVEPEPGVLVIRRPEPLARAGVYAPGGRAAYPSSVLMGVVPARVAGVSEVIVCSPPRLDGAPHPTVLAAAALTGADRVYAVGGAVAIAAMAYGTARLPRVDRVVGPGNVWVNEAKRQVAGTVGIDSPAGPSELLVLADETADPARVAREALAQAEHDPDACVVVACTGAALATRIEQAIAAGLDTLDRAAIARRALAARGGVLVMDAAEFVGFAEAYAPEHLLVLTVDAHQLAERVRRAGAVFAGPASSVVFGDYLSGANHVLPTQGLAASWSGLSTSDFVRWTTEQRVTPGAAAALAADAATFAEAEGLFGHAAAARAWLGAAPTRGEWLDLSDNTGRFGSAPTALRAPADGDEPSRYPSPHADDLRAALARRLGVPEERIVTGCGSDDVIEIALRALTAPGDAIAISDPTFSMLPVFAARLGLACRRAPVRSDGGHDLDALAGAGARVIYLASPDNPTGSAAGRAAIAGLLERCDATLLLDQAYAEFEPDAPFFDHARVVVTRTLSKAFGLAGLRVGYGWGPSAIASRMAEIRGPYRVAAASERAATQALLHDAAWVLDRAAEARAERAWLALRLGALGLAPLPSDANFLLLPVPDAGRAAAELERRGIGVRAFAGLATIGDAVRITVAPRPAMERVAGAIEDAITSFRPAVAGEEER